MGHNILSYKAKELTYNFIDEYTYFRNGKKINIPARLSYSTNGNMS